jgi:hypothetical protein
MTRIAVAIALLPAISCAQDPAALLAKARTAFIENRQRERYWNWTTITTRTILGKDDHEIETLPSVTVESPISSSGERCNAVLAWGDGRAPYLADATADERCAVEKEFQEMLKIPDVLASSKVKVVSRSATGITLAISPDSERMKSKDPAERCSASVQATLHLDPATSFPKKIEIRVPGGSCDVQGGSAENHYDETEIKHVRSGYTKGTLLDFEFEFRSGKGGDSSRNFWIATHRHSVRPLRNNNGGMLISGRLFPLEPGPDRRLVIDTRTTVSELSAESTVTFEKQQ